MGRLLGGAGTTALISRRCGPCGTERGRHSVPKYEEFTGDGGRPLCRAAQVSRRVAVMLHIAESGSKEGLI
jgi:hypothetical protein